MEVGVGWAAEPAAPELGNNFSHPTWPESPFALYIGPLAAKIGLFSVNVLKIFRELNDNKLSFSNIKNGFFKCVIKSFCCSEEI